MDAVKYFKEKARMTKDCGIDCISCPLSHFNNGLLDIGCEALENHYTEKAVEIVEKWAKEHPINTRQGEFLKMFPNARLDNNGVIEICPKLFDSTINLDCDVGCSDCCKEYWLKEVK